MLEKISFAFGFIVSILVVGVPETFWSWSACIVAYSIGYFGGRYVFDRFWK